MVFLQRYYSVYDNDCSRVGFARTLFTNVTDMSGHRLSLSVTVTTSESVYPYTPLGPHDGPRLLVHHRQTF
jgi:hypothetical protein